MQTHRSRTVFRAILAAAFLSTFAFGTLAAQDLKITYKTKVGAMMMSHKGTEVEYHSQRYKRTNDTEEKTDTLIDYQDCVRYEIGHKKKVVKLTRLEDTLKLRELIAADIKEAMDADTDGKKRKKMEEFFGKDVSPSIKRAGTEVIAGRNCEKWDISVGKFTCKASADPTLAPPAPPEILEKASKLEDSFLSDLLGMGNIGKLFGAISKIKGVQLKSEIVLPIGGWITIKIFREATEIVPGPIPDSVFELPKGYTEEDAGKKELEEYEKRRKERLEKKKK